MIFKTDMLLNRKAFLLESRETANTMTHYFSDINLLKIIVKFAMLFHFITPAKLLQIQYIVNI